METVGGLDSALTGIYQEADCCFRLSEHGYQIVVIPEVTAVQYGKEKTEEKKEPLQLFFERWKQKFLVPDPCYNSNLSLKVNHTKKKKKM